MHTEKLMEVINRDMAKLQAHLAGLRLTLGGIAGSDPGSAPGRRSKAGRPAPAAEPPEEPANFTARTRAIIAVARGLREPFSPETIAAAAGIERIAANIWINNQARPRGWILRLGHGQYRRTGMYPKPA